MLEISLDDRIKWLDKNLIKCSDNELVLTETNPEGIAELKCVLKNYTLAFSKWDKKTFKFFAEQKCADEILFEKINDNDWVIHIIEFKKSVKSKEWEAIKKQFNCAFMNACACAGILMIQNIKEIKCYTAYRNDQLGANPVLLKTGVGMLPKSSDTSLDWMFGNICLPVLNHQQVKHVKIQLDKQTGSGTVQL